MYLIEAIKEFLYEKKWTLILYVIVILFSYPLESIVLPQIYSNFFEVLNQKTPMETYMRFFIYILVALVVIYTAYSSINILEIKIIPEIHGYMFNYIYKNLLIKYQDEFPDFELGKIISRVDNIPANFNNTLTTICKWILPQMLTIIIINIYFFYLSWELGLTSISLIIIFLVVNYFFFNRCTVSSHERHVIFENAAEKTQDNLSNIHSIYAAGKIDDEIKNFKNRIETYVNKYKENQTCIFNIGVFTNMFMVILFIVLNGITVYLYMKKRITYTNLMSVFITIIYYSPCVNSIGASLYEMVSYVGVLIASEEFMKDMVEASRVKRSNDKHIITSGAVNIKNLAFSYGKGHYLFDDFSLNIPSGQKIAILGNSGNGKSTLIKLIMGYFPVEEDTIFIDGMDIHKTSLNELRQQISYVNQNNKLFNKTLLENIQYGNNMTEEDILALIKRIDVENIFKNLPDGLNTNVGVNGDRLSGGQKQMVHILRCIGKKNRLVILDEPTASIDKYNKVSVVKGINELSKTSTMIIITHDESILGMVDRIVRLDAGVITEDYYPKKNK